MINPHGPLDWPQQSTNSSENLVTVDREVCPEGGGTGGKWGVRDRSTFRRD